MRSIVFPLTSISLAAVVLAACGAEGPSAGDLNNGLMTDPTGSTTGPAVPAQTSTGPATTMGPAPMATPTMTMTGPRPPPMTSTTAPPSPTDEPDPVPGTEPTDGPDPAPTDTTGPVDPMPTDTAGAGGAPPVDPMPTTEPVPGGGGMPAVDPGPVSTEPVEPQPPAGPYAPRTGPFNMLVYSKTAAFPHPSIPTGIAMLEEIAADYGITMTSTNTNELITAEGLANFELVFFMNSTGDIFNNAEQQAFEDWMTSERGGAFAGVHSATDTENGWAFYSEVTGQYYDLHDDCCSEAEIQWDPAALTHPTVVGLPNPWRRAEEWYKFFRAEEWQGKEGFQILSRVTTNSGGTRPVSFVREFMNFRSFYTSLGHESVAFQDDNVKKHVAAGIMWAARREAEIK